LGHGSIRWGYRGGKLCDPRTGSVGVIIRNTTPGIPPSPSHYDHNNGKKITSTSRQQQSQSSSQTPIRLTPSVQPLTASPVTKSVDDIEAPPRNWESIWSFTIHYHHQNYLSRRNQLHNNKYNTDKHPTHAPPPPPLRTVRGQGGPSTRALGHYSEQWRRHERNIQSSECRELYPHSVR